WMLTVWKSLHLSTGGPRQVKSLAAIRQLIHFLSLIGSNRVLSARSASIPVVRVRPDLLDVEVHSATEKYYSSVFLAHAKAVVVLECLIGRAVVTYVLLAPLDHDEILVHLRGRSPIPVILVP